MKPNISYKEVAELVCTENGKKLTAEVLDFKPAYSLSVSVERQVRVNLRYNMEKKMYMGNVGSLEFSSTGPKETIKIKGRR
jgi:hypothetical protein